MGLFSALANLFSSNKKKTNTSSNKGGGGFRGSNSYSSTPSIITSAPTTPAVSKPSKPAIVTSAPTTPAVSTPTYTAPVVSTPVKQTVSTPTYIPPTNTNLNAIIKGAEYASQGLPQIPVNTQSSSSSNKTSNSNKSVVYVDKPATTKPIINDPFNPQLSAIIKGAEYASQGLPLIPYNKNTSSSSNSSSSSNVSNGSSGSSNVSKNTSSTQQSAGGSGSSYVSSSGGGTVATQAPITIDLSDILAAYTKSAEAQKKSISDATAAQRKMLEDTLASRIKSLQTSESTQRENLLTSLKRFQEDTAQSRKQQQSSFNASRADLEAQAFMANRAAMQSAAARGLGGSGLQQLAQIQNMINQSGEINDLAIANTDALNALAQAYARQEQDTNTNISNLARDTQNQIDSLTTEQKNTLSSLISQEANSLNEIETNTTSLKEQLKYQEAVRAENARVQAEQFAANLQAQNAQIAANYDLYNRQLQAEKEATNNATITGLAGALDKYSNLIKSASNYSTAKKPADKLEENNRKVQETYDEAVSALAAIYAGSGLNQSYLDTYRKQLDDVYGKYYRG